jgi:hypothetical protein
MITVLQKYTAESCGNDAFAYIATGSGQHQRV